MITFRRIFEQLVSELTPNKGHLSVEWDAKLFMYVDYDNPRFAPELIDFLKQNDIEFQAAEELADGWAPEWVKTNVPSQFVPEVLYFALSKFPDKEILKNPSFAKEGSYRFMLFDSYGEGYMDLVFVDDGAGQALGMFMVDYEQELKHFTKHFKKRPLQVHLSKMVPSVKGTGEGHKMYSLLLDKFGTIMSDSTLFEGSFAMWDTAIRQSAPYSGVTAFNDSLVYANSKGDVYTMSLPNDTLDRFWASKTIAPWVLQTSKALSKLDAKTTVVADVTTKKSLPLVVEIIDKVSDDSSIKDLLLYLDQDRYDTQYVYNPKYINKASTLLLVVSAYDDNDIEGIIKVTQKGSNLDVTLL